MLAVAPLHFHPQIFPTFTAKNYALLSSPAIFSTFSADFPCKRRMRCSIVRFCTQKASSKDPFEDFAALDCNVPWDVKDVWTTFAAYFFILHIPLSFGGLSVVARILHATNLDSLTMAVSTNILQIAEYFGALTLFRYNAKSHSKFSKFLEKIWKSKERNWLKASFTGIGFLSGLVVLTSIVADTLIGSKDVNNPVLKEILLASPFSRAACISLYCIVAPLLEETVYRGILLSSLASTMEWWKAVIVSSIIFSIGHFSGENSLQLFLIGCVLGAAYCWSGTLRSCFTIHSLYNGLILLITIMS